MQVCHTLFCVRQLPNTLKIPCLAGLESSSDARRPQHKIFLPQIAQNQSKLGYSGSSMKTQQNNIGNKNRDRITASACHKSSVATYAQEENNVGYER
jgi:hypothetical protein